MENDIECTFLKFIKNKFGIYIEDFFKSIFDNSWTILWFIGGLILLGIGYGVNRIHLNYADLFGSVFMTGGIAVISGIVVKSFLANGIFLDRTRKIFEETLTNDTFLKYLSPEYRKNILDRIKEIDHNIINISYDLLKVESIEKVKTFHNGKNYYVKESHLVKTILKSGCEISTFRFVIEILKKGTVTFDYQVSTSNPNLQYINFSGFKGDRFHEFSFDKKILAYKRNNQKLAKEEFPEIIIDEKKIIDLSNRKVIPMTIHNTEVGDEIEFMYSITIKDEFTDDVIKKIKKKEISEPGILFTSVHGIRNITFQVEKYNSEKICLSSELSAKLSLCDSSNVETVSKSPAITEDLFYKRYNWVLYASENAEERIRFIIY